MDTDIAKKIYYCTMMIDQGKVEFYRRRARQLLKFGKYEQAFDDAMKSTQLEDDQSPEHWRTWSTVAHALIGQNKLDKAMEILK